MKSGEEFPLLTVTHANPPIVDGHSCHIELLKFLKAEGLKVRIQYESMYGEPHETIAESGFDSDMMADIATAAMQRLAPELAEQLQKSVAQLSQLVDQMQRSYVDFMKRMADLEGQMLIEELYENLYEDPPGAPQDWWLQKRHSPMHPQD